MTDMYLAAVSIEQPGTHAEWDVFGLTINADTVIGTLIAAAIVIGLGLFVRAKVTSGVPNGVQLSFETVNRLMRTQIENAIGVKVAPFLVPLSITLFLLILTCNWLSVLPMNFGENGGDVLPPPTSDVNLVYALAILLFVWRYAVGIRRHKGLGKHLLHVYKGHYAALGPLWILEEFTNLISLPLRLFGNIFAGGIMIEVLGLLPGYVLWLPNAAWKLFDLGIGLIQAFIFVLLTIVYFSDAMEIREGEH
ncbi:MAG TPA: F0F1 ATP synthase subunit A [Pseudonocardiaceae bacterium]|jgi:F-type H+-transporting ATPase subunit a|nr:F0F1 ATP synthase subunit A [Pseudonocardiaceae bacterium]